MSRSGYSEDVDDSWELICWRGAVKSALRGSRGQAFLRELVAALDAMPDKRLIANGFVNEGGCCAMGAVALARGIDPEVIREIEELSDPENDLGDEGALGAAKALDIAPAMAKEIAFENDEMWSSEGAGAKRWQRMRAWAVGNLEVAP